MKRNAANARASENSGTAVSRRKSSQGPRLHFQIDRITLHGYTANAHARFVNSFRESLLSLAPTLGSPGLARVSRKLTSLDAGLLRPELSAEEAGRQVARQIVAALGKCTRGNGSV